ncbi:MAG: hypothetical protein A2086_15645 [Spirochaetes bacterium GWD1_27_9]|nr:MAG: hypothetical protein A2Z98_14195 [Spirochaetes bacterium GWB1_27_13]OHD22485.1 MAG: hypothetical protein A2Y34_06700 [Spirochaetes bacterium GWC1_27_15]OHD42815.1 MAG: hypothetical protein A2086_15645 [Spirochaetes bacterium GWD1_27_9]
MKIKFLLFLLLFSYQIFSVNSIVLNEKINLTQKLQELDYSINIGKYSDAKIILNKIKNDYVDTEFVCLANAYFAKIEYLQKNYYPALYYIELALNDKNLKNLFTTEQSKIFFLGGEIYYKLEKFDECITEFTKCINENFDKLDSLYLYLTQIYAIKNKDFVKGKYYFSKINPKKLNFLEKDIYYYMINNILWEKIDTANIGYKDPNVSSIRLDKDLIYIGLYNGGLIEYNYILDTYDYYPKGAIVSENVRDIYIDGRFIYIGTTEGVSIIDKRNGFVANPPELKDISFTSIEGNANTIYFGTLGNGVIIYDKLKKEYSTINYPSNISGLFIIENSLYVSGYDSKFYLYKDNQMFNISKKNSPKTPITDIIKEDNFLWLSTYGEGIFKYDTINETYTHYSYETGQLKENYCLCIAKNQNKIYCGTLGNGIYVYNLKKDKWEEFSIPPDFLGSDIKKIVFNDKYMFIATLGEGVLKKFVVEN